MEEYKRIRRDLVHKGHIIDVYTDQVVLPDERVAEWDFIGHKGAAAIIPIDEDGKIIMVRQFRNAIDTNTLEIPAGGLYHGEDMMTCAIRECEEETGYKTKSATHLIDIHTSVAFCNEKIGIFFTDELFESKQHLDEDEFVSIERYTFEELSDKIFKGEITDAKTIAGLFALKQYKENHKY